MFDWGSFGIGTLVGAIAMLFAIWVAYVSRSFMFTYCARQPRMCSGGDYYTNPGDALANNPQLSVSDILFVNDDNELYYKRVPEVGTCNPQGNQLVYIRNPEYCAFSGGGVTGTWKQIQFGSRVYVSTADPTDAPIYSDADCQPNAGQAATSGTTLVRWDST